MFRLQNFFLIMQNFLHEAEKNHFLQPRKPGLLYCKFFILSWTLFIKGRHFKIAYLGETRRQKVLLYQEPIVLQMDL